MMEDNLSSAQVFGRRLRVDFREVSLKRLHDLERVLRDPSRCSETACYLGAQRKRGNQGTVGGDVELGTCMGRTLKKFPQATFDFYHLQLADMRGHTAAEPSADLARASIWRCKAVRKRNSFFSGLQDSARTNPNGLIFSNEV